MNGRTAGQPCVRWHGPRIPPDAGLDRRRHRSGIPCQDLCHDANHTLGQALILCRPARDGVLVRWGLPVSGPVFFRTDQKGTGRPAKVTETRREPLKLPAKPFVTERSRNEHEVPARLPAPLADAVASSGGWPFVLHEVSESTVVPPDQFCDRCQQPNVKDGPSSFLMTEPVFR